MAGAPKIPLPSGQLVMKPTTLMEKPGTGRQFVADEHVEEFKLKGFKVVEDEPTDTTTVDTDEAPVDLEDQKPADPVDEPVSDGLDSLSGPELKVLVAQHNITVKGGLGKASLIAALRAAGVKAE